MIFENPNLSETKPTLITGETCIAIKVIIHDTLSRVVTLSSII